MEQTMTRLELLTLLLSIQALLESGNEEAAKKLIAEVISEAKKQQFRQISCKQQRKSGTCRRSYI